MWDLSFLKNGFGRSHEKCAETQLTHNGLPKRILRIYNILAKSILCINYPLANIILCINNGLTEGILSICNLNWDSIIEDAIKIQHYSVSTNITYILANMICNVLVTLLELPLHFGVLVFHVQADAIQSLCIPFHETSDVEIICSVIVLTINGRVWGLYMPQKSIQIDNRSNM